MEYYLFIFIFTLSTVYPLSWETGSFRIQVRRTGFAMKVLFSERSLSLVPAPSLWVPPLPFWRKGPTGNLTTKTRLMALSVSTVCLETKGESVRKEGRGAGTPRQTPQSMGSGGGPGGDFTAYPFLRYGTIAALCVFS